MANSFLFVQKTLYLQQNRLCMIGKKLKDYRHSHYISKMQMAKDTGISMMTISNIEEGRTNPTLSNIKKICDYLGLSLMIVDTEGKAI